MSLELNLKCFLILSAVEHRHVKSKNMFHNIVPLNRTENWPRPKQERYLGGCTVDPLTAAYYAN